MRPSKQNKINSQYTSFICNCNVLIWVEAEKAEFSKTKKLAKGVEHTKFCAVNWTGHWSEVPVSVLNGNKFGMMKNDEKQTKTKKNHEKLRKTKRNDEKKWFTHFCCKLSFVAITRLLGGHFLLKFGAWGHKNILMDRGYPPPPLNGPKSKNFLPQA